jgi:membrane associated rhomboid family serine protease
MNVVISENSSFISAPGRKVAEEYAILLISLSIDNKVVFHNGVWNVEVSSDDLEKAVAEINNYESNGRIERPVSRFDHISFQKLNYLYFFSFLLALAAFHVVVYAYPELGFIKAGRSSASAITDGYFYRAVTALTLHADLKHLLSNIFFGGIAVFSLATMIGTGYSWFLFLLSGAFGNVLNAYFYGSAHNSIGASTAVFGVVGVLAGLQFLSRFREKKTYAWIPFAAAVGLLAMLGSSEKTDVMAHLFGFVAGVPLGFLTGWILSKTQIPGKFCQFFIFLVTCAVFILSWMKAV